MSEDGEPKTGGVPSWQLTPKSSNALKDTQDTTPKSTQSRASLIEDARRFLQDAEVRDAPTDKQLAFLESKGLERHEIEELLGLSRIEEANPTTEATPEAPPNQVQPLQSPEQPPQTAHDIPPIITYPEFLVKPPRPAPLITAKRLLTSLYLFGGLSALLYGTSNYVIAPMVASLTSSRHSLSETALSNLDRLISKLGGTVSEIPADQIPRKAIEPSEIDSDGDPTELFHRDIGVQTSTPPSPTLASMPIYLQPTIERQSRKLDLVSKHVKELIEKYSAEEDDLSQVSTCAGILRDYLDSLTYISPVYSYGANGMYGNSGQKNDFIDDEISKVKARIRDVKGVLLSARSFPGGTGVGRAR